MRVPTGATAITTAAEKSTIAAVTPAADGARLVRADGPGWSLAARTDDIALLLLDEMPREVLPIGRGPELPALLHALDRMARASS